MIAGSSHDALRHYRSVEATGPPLLLVHGLGESGRCFDRLLDDPGAWSRRRVIVVELAGYGRTPPQSAPSSLQDLAVELEQWLHRQIGAERVVAIGHSMGGVIAQFLAERFPGRLLGLVDVDGNISLEDCAYSGHAAALDYEEFAASGFDRLREKVREMGRNDEAHAGYYESLILADGMTFHQHARELVTLSRGEKLAKRLAALPIPVLYLAGSPGGVCPRSKELLRDAGVTMAEVGPSGHWPFIDRPGAFTAVVDGFVRTLRCV